jgi:hypothetical protein
MLIFKGSISEELVESPMSAWCDNFEDLFNKFLVSDIMPFKIKYQLTVSESNIIIEVYDDLRISEIELLIDSLNWQNIAREVGVVVKPPIEYHVCSWDWEVMYKK